MQENIVQNEESFHDAWAAEVDVSKINVTEVWNACTSPELRFIKNSLGDLTGKTILDIGCGFGESSVYFALQGATVTASDLSEGMLEVTSRLASANNVKLRTHKASAESLMLGAHEKFDFVYMGNILHHANIEVALQNAIPHMKENGTFISWDPIKYNPVIEVYRLLATKVRTEDEHPFTFKDFKTFKRNFATVEFKFFWLTTLLIFIAMFVFQRRSPNKERYWKKVIEESKYWEPYFKPLEKVDNFLLKVFPPLGYLCWNVVIFAKKPIVN